MIDQLGGLGAAAADVRVWIALALAVGAIAILVPLGVLASRRVGILSAESDRLETFSLGLSVALVAFAAVWAAIASAGASVFAPSAVTVVAAIAIAPGRPTLRPRLDRPSVTAALWVVAFIVAIGFLYAATIAPSPRYGLQPIEFFDTGYYAVLGADLAETGRESIYSPAGFDQVSGVPPQTWYHWGELWLAASVIALTDISPLHARHLVVLPILLLAVASTVGSAVRHVVSRQSTEYVLLAAGAALFLAPIPVLHDPDIEWFARALVISITQYGLAVVVIAIAAHATVRHTAPTPTNRLLAAALGAAFMASHIGLAVTALGAASILTLLYVVHGVWLAGPRRVAFRTSLAQTQLVWLAMIGSASTLVWGWGTGHGLGGLAPIEGIAPFDAAWARAIMETVVGAGVILAVPLAWLVTGNRTEGLHRLLVGAVLSVALGAAAWGVMVADLNSFHLFFGSIVTILTPAVAIASVALLHRLRARRRAALASVVLACVLGQTVIAALIAGLQLRGFGPLPYTPTPVAALEALRSLPPGSKAAYGCNPLENFAPWDASLVSLDAHTGVRMVPMCFMADRPRRILGRELDASIESPYFAIAPQRELYPELGASPSSEAVRSFLLANGVAYLFVDTAHPHLLVPDALPVFVDDGVGIYQIR